MAKLKWGVLADALCLWQVKPDSLMVQTKLYSKMLSEIFVYMLISLCQCINTSTLFIKLPNLNREKIVRLIHTQGATIQIVFYLFLNHIDCCATQGASAHAEIKVPSVENPEAELPEVLPGKPGESQNMS